MAVSRMSVKDDICLFHLSITCWFVRINQAMKLCVKSCERRYVLIHLSLTCWFVRINQGIQSVKLELARWLKLSIR